MNKLSFYERCTATGVFCAVFLLLLIFMDMAGIKFAKLILDLWMHTPFGFVIVGIVYFLAPNIYSLFNFKAKNTNKESFFYKFKITLFLTLITLIPFTVIADIVYSYPQIKPKFFLFFEDFRVILFIFIFYWFVITPAIIKFLQKHNINWFDT